MRWPGHSMWQHSLMHVLLLQTAVANVHTLVCLYINLE